MSNKEPKNAEGKSQTSGRGRPFRGSFILLRFSIPCSSFVLCFPLHHTLSRSTHSTGGPDTTLRRLPAPVNHRNAAATSPGRGRGLWQGARIASNPWHPEIGVPAAVAGATDCLPIGAERDRCPVPGNPVVGAVFCGGCCGCHAERSRGISPRIRFLLPFPHPPLRAPRPLR